MLSNLYTSFMDAIHHLFGEDSTNADLEVQPLQNKKTESKLPVNVLKPFDKQSALRLDVLSEKDAKKLDTHWLNTFIQLINDGVKEFNQTAIIAVDGYIPPNHPDRLALKAVLADYQANEDSQLLAQYAELITRLSHQRVRTQIASLLDIINLMPALFEEITRTLERREQRDDALVKTYRAYLMTLQQDIQQAQTQLAAVIYRKILAYSAEKHCWWFKPDEFIPLQHFVEQHGDAKTKQALHALPWFSNTPVTTCVSTQQGTYIFPNCFIDTHAFHDKPPRFAWLRPQATQRYHLRREAMLSAVKVSTAFTQIHQQLAAPIHYQSTLVDSIFTTLQKAQVMLQTESQHYQAKKVTGWKRLFYRQTNRLVEQWALDLQQQTQVFLMKKYGVLQGFVQQIKADIANQQLPSATALQTIRDYILALQQEVLKTDLAKVVLALQEQFEQATDFRCLFIERLMKKDIFSKHLQSYSSHTIQTPNEIEVTHFIQTALKYLKDDNAYAFVVIQQFILGKQLITVNQLTHAIAPLFKQYQEPEKAMQAFIRHLVEEYIKPNVSSSDSPAYQFLAEYEPDYLTALHQQQAHQAEVAVKLFKQILEANSELPLDGRCILSIDEESVAVTLDLMAKQLGFSKDLYPVNQHFYETTKTLFTQYVQHFTERSPKSTQYAPLITYLGDEELMRQYGMALFHEYLQSPAELLNIAFFVEHKNLLQSAIDEALIQQLQNAPIQIIQKDNQIFQLQQLPVQLRDAVEAFGSTQMQYTYRLAWLKAMLFEPGFSVKQSLYFFKETNVDTLMLFFGEENIVDVLNQLAIFLTGDVQADNPMAYDLINRFLTQEFLDRYDCKHLAQQLTQHLDKIKQHKEAQGLAKAWMTLIEKQEWALARSQLTSIADNLVLYKDDIEMYKYNQLILSSIKQPLIAYLQQLQQKGYVKTLQDIQQQLIVCWPHAEEKPYLQEQCLINLQQFNQANQKFALQDLQHYLDSYAARKGFHYSAIDKLTEAYSFYKQFEQEAPYAFCIAKIEQVYQKVAADLFTFLKQASIQDIQQHQHYLSEVARWVRLMNKPQDKALLKRYGDKLFIRYLDMTKAALDKYGSQIPEESNTVLWAFEDILEQAGLPAIQEISQALEKHDKETFHAFYQQYREQFVNQYLTQRYLKKLLQLDEQIFQAIQAEYQYSEEELQHVKRLLDKMIRRGIDDVRQLSLSPDDMQVLRLDTPGFKKAFKLQRIGSIETALNLLAKSHLTGIQLERFLPSSPMKVSAADKLNAQLRETAAIMRNSPIRSVLLGKQQQGFFSSFNKKFQITQVNQSLPVKRHSF